MIGRLVIAVLLGVVSIGATSWARAEIVAPGKPAPEIASGAWVNSDPLTMAGLRGRVVLVDFWTFG